jgi:hypothetical protein
MRAYSRITITAPPRLDNVEVPAFKAGEVTGQELNGPPSMGAKNKKKVKQQDAHSGPHPTSTRQKLMGHGINAGEQHRTRKISTEIHWKRQAHHYLFRTGSLR